MNGEDVLSFQRAEGILERKLTQTSSIPISILANLNRQGLHTLSLALLEEMATNVILTIPPKEFGPCDSGSIFKKEKKKKACIFAFILFKNILKRKPNN
jgi:hypothetical protein